MKIERINENQIKFTLTRSDLASRQIRLSEIAYCTDKAKGLFQDMMDQASLEFGFDSSEFPFMIETIPVSMDCIILMFTKVDDPQEMDSRFSQIANFGDMFGKEPSELFDFSSLFDETANPELAELGKLMGKPIKTAPAATEAFFSFEVLDRIIDFAKSSSGYASGNSRLYKSPEDGRYYLLIKPSPKKDEEFTKLCNMALEFGNSETVSYSRAAYIEEHFEKIIKDNALRKLSCL